MLEAFPSKSPFSAAKQYATRVAMPLIFAVPYVEAIDTRGSTMWKEAEIWREAKLRVKQEKCVNCGTKKKDLKRCTRCKYVKYCNSACQKAHWKTHKNFCREKPNDE